MTQPEEHEAAVPRPEVHASLLSSTEGCPNCGAQFAADQRYCIECGERVGTTRAPIATQAVAAPAIAPPPRRVRMSPNATLIAGIGTLLLALGIGVLIGRSGNNASGKTSSVQVVSVPGAGAASSAAQPSTAASTTVASSSAKSAKHKTSKSATSKTIVKKIPNKVVKVGVTKGSGPGYDKKTHKFTGNFFGQ